MPNSVVVPGGAQTQSLANVSEKDLPPSGQLVRPRHPGENSCEAETTSVPVDELQAPGFVLPDWSCKYGLLR